MPVYLLRGFKWARKQIRIHVVEKILDDVAPDWLVAPASQEALLNSFCEFYPNIMSVIPQLRFIEQYDPNDLYLKNQDFAYVADVVHEIKLGADVDELREGNTPYEQWEALRQLRNELAPNEKVAWYIVYCGDLERSFSPASTPITETFSRVPSQQSDWAHAGISSRSMTSHTTSERQVRNDFTAHRSRRSSITRSFRKVFGGGGGSLKKAKSLKDLNIGDRKSVVSGRASSPPPPMPELRPPGTAH